MDTLQLALFDWGNTLMRDDPARTTPMVDWPDDAIEVLAGARELIALLQRSGVACGIASSARISSPAQIEAALFERGGFSAPIAPIFCWGNTGAEKTNPQFWHKVLQACQLPARQVLMVGDSFEGDVRVPASKGLAALWFNPANDEARTGPGYSTVHQLQDVPAALAGLGLQLPGSSRVC